MSTEQELLSEAVRETEAEIFNEATSDATPETETPQEPVVEETDNRDPETGRFTAKEKPEPEKAEPEVQPEKADADDQGQIPSWRLREVAEERRAAKAEAEQAKREADALKAEMAQLRQQMQQQPKPEAKQEEIDPLIDPQGFAKRMQDSFDKRLQEIQLNNNLAIAHVKHGEKFEKAYNAFLQAAQQGDRATYQSVMQSPNPGEAMVRWHMNQEALKEFGPDPSAYKQKLQDELLKNPDFLAKAVEAARASAGAQPKQNTVTQLPPSLSRATGSQRATSVEDDTDNSDTAVFNYAFR